MKREFTPEQLANMRGVHLPAKRACQPENWAKLKRLCADAMLDARTADECYLVDGWLTNPSSILWQIYFGRIQGVYLVETLDENPIAIAAYSLHDQIMFAPRRTFIRPEFRNGNLLAKFVLGDMFQLGATEGKSYAVMSFNTARRGRLQFGLHASNSRMFLGENSVIPHFEMVCPYPLMVMGVPQLCLYAKLDASAPDLMTHQVETELRAK